MTSKSRPDKRLRRSRKAAPPRKSKSRPKAFVGAAAALVGLALTAVASRLYKAKRRQLMAAQPTAYVPNPNPVSDAGHTTDTTPDHTSKEETA